MQNNYKEIKMSANFRKIRRSKQELNRDESVDILRRTTSGVLGLAGDCEYPDTVPMSYVYDNCKIYFHSSKTGHKVSICKNEETMRYAMNLLAKKYAPYDTAQNREAAIEREFNQLAVVVMEIEHMTGKEAIELTQKD